MQNLYTSVLSSARRCKKWALVIFTLYTLSCLAGMYMVHSGSSFALSYRDKVVGAAIAKDQASINYKKGNRFKAALLDFSGNLFIGAIPQTIMGLSVVVPCVTTVYQGWIGGIVSVDGHHRSRLKTSKSALYYFIVLLLQYIPYSLAIGSGLRLGVETYKVNRGGKLSRYKIDQPSLKDVLYIYVLVVPLFFIASCFEFMSTWNV